MLSLPDQKDRDTDADRDDCQEDERGLNSVEHHDTSRQTRQDWGQ